MIFFCYPGCFTCQRAEKFLNAHNAPYTARDIKREHPNETELADLYRRSGLPLKRFFNTSGLVYKSLGLKDRLADMSEAEQLALLATDGMLVKRPILDLGARVLVGFREGEWEAAFSV